ncbi:hypothetical protein BC628DRAFT_109090 [Trametes gibbosa]|nr:hypothetical protein BC628DRAFT_615612 [Trametes gibbosa]KAI0828294.1 hypothetical protein BC628DRAFT_109090 [Trametes gibbosa]
MHKDSKENTADKASKKAKDTAARRSSAIHIAPPRASVEKPPVRKELDASPEVKTITRHTRRQSALKKAIAPLEDNSSSPSDNASPKGSISTRSSVRNRNSLVSSGLPKYRPRSMLGDSALVPPKKAPSPAHNSRRRRLSSSDDETDEVKTPKDPFPARRSRRAEQVGTIYLTFTTPKRSSGEPYHRYQRTTRHPREEGHGQGSEGLSCFGPHNIYEGIKGWQDHSYPSPASASARSTLPRPPSSASSSASASSRTPRTPTTPTLFGNLLKGNSGSLRQQNTHSGSSPLRGVIPAAPESPLGRFSARRNAGSGHSRGPSAPVTPTPQIITQDSSMDSLEADDVEFMLSSIASPTAPTPALPRFRTRVDTGDDDPHTPSRSSFLPSRANLSYVSPAPPSSTESSPFLRPKPRQPGNDRGSILSWEQLAQHSKTLEDEDVERMISEVPAPFRAGAISPSLSVIDIPDSPSLSALPSPTGYGSISQVLLPDVTPSPAVHNTTHLFDSFKQDTPAATDGATVTLLRLQLAAAESRAQERLAQMQSLEEQLHAAKAARMRDADELAKQISQLEDQVHGNLAVENQRAEQIAVLEEMLRDAQSMQDNAAKDASRRADHAMATARTAALQIKQVQARSAMAIAACEAGTAWGVVRHTAESELDFLHANRETLALLLVGLDHKASSLLK